MKFKLHFLLLIIALTVVFAGCSEKTGILPEPVPEPTYVTPTIYDLQVQNNSISKCGGGIMTLSCTWSSPYKVSTATAYLGFVKTIKNPSTEPIGVIGSQTTEVLAGMRGQVATDCNASDTAAFFTKYAEPIKIPTKIGTNELSGRWEVEIPFAPEDTSIAPLGVYQMIFYMEMNRLKTNTLAFEMTFIP
jgi:hypothetical protein